MPPLQMPLQNRVTPSGEIIAATQRGTMLGNRGGCFHTASQRIKPRPYASKQWICCVLDFKGRRRSVMSPGLYTELFFLDEATALAAGHRPCFECRRADATRFAEIWAERTGHTKRASAPEMDVVLQSERINAKHQKITFNASLASLPNGTFVQAHGMPHLKWDAKFWPWSLDGYDKATVIDASETFKVLTPSSIVAQLTAGYKPTVHPSLVIYPLPNTAVRDRP